MRGRNNGAGGRQQLHWELLLLLGLSFVLEWSRCYSKLSMLSLFEGEIVCGGGGVTMILEDG